MAFKPNYGQERAARNRAKDQKKQEKLQRRQEESERRKAGIGAAEGLAGADAATDIPPAPDNPAEEGGDGK